MKNLFWMLVMILGMQTLAHSTTNPETEETIETHTLSVVAGSGLKLREGPSLQSDVIKVIPYGHIVATIADTAHVEDRIEWMEGHWMKVDHEGDEGYVFNGFLSSLPLPSFDFEFSREDLELMPALDSWFSYRFDQISEPVIFEGTEQVKVVAAYSDGHKKIELETPYMYKYSVQLKDVEIHEAYNLVRNMLMTGYEKATFNNKSVFVQNNVGEIYKIKIDLPEPVEIRRISDHEIQISIKSFHEGCKL